MSNAAVRVAGRLDAAEAERPEYRFMPSSTRLRTTILAPGTMVVHQPDVPTPVLLTFPFPAWATRAEEREMIQSMCTQARRIAEVIRTLAERQDAPRVRVEGAQRMLDLR